VLVILIEAMSVSVAVVLCCFAVTSGNQINMVARNNAPAPTQHYTHSVVLDEDRFRLYWNFNKTHITFEVTVT